MPLLPRYTDTPIEHDPLEAHLAAMEQREAAARRAVADGAAPDADTADLRGIPAIGRGVAGVIRDPDNDTQSLMAQRPGTTL